MSLQRNIDLKGLAEKMGQCSGAEVRGICTEAGECFFLLGRHSVCFPAPAAAPGFYVLGVLSEQYLLEHR
jgi:hypothetical protein